MSPISSHEILIMAESSVQIFDVKSSTMEKVGTVNFDCLGLINQAVMSREGQVVALV